MRMRNASRILQIMRKSSFAPDSSQEPPHGVIANEVLGAGGGLAGTMAAGRRKAGIGLAQQAAVVGVRRGFR